MAADLLDFLGDYATRGKLVTEDGSVFNVASMIHYEPGSEIPLQQKTGKSAMTLAISQRKEPYTNAVVKRVKVAPKNSYFGRYATGILDSVTGFERRLDLDADCAKTWDGAFECTLPILGEHAPSMGSIFLTQPNDDVGFECYSALADHFLKDVRKQRQETANATEAEVRIPLARCINETSIYESHELVPTIIGVDT